MMSSENPHSYHVRRVANYLMEQGYKIISLETLYNNGRKPPVEIDILAEKGGSKIVIEVKTSPVSPNGKRERAQYERIKSVFSDSTVYFVYPSSGRYKFIEME